MVGGHERSQHSVPVVKGATERQDAVLSDRELEVRQWEHIVAA